MTRFAIRILVVLAVVLVPAMLLASPAAPSKVCHPKKPVTCHADVIVPEISNLTESAEAISPAASVTPQFEFNTAMVCFGPRWLCKAETLTEPEQKPAPQPESQQAMVCFGPRWLCKAETIG